eukprot:TRINITY_DN6479_c0_g1_i3.p1 TRINITY_DN6479_c0_g1~~TRINITY_DN6479_c0_g1_i3.p1  ORF type:complete len:1351 (-),score=383.77 TRINITY_DN6479_c0_g1_i3:918-4970(-)
MQQRSTPPPMLAAEVRALRALLPRESGEDSAARTARRELPFRVFCRFRGQSDAEEARGGFEAWSADGQTVEATEESSRLAGAVPRFTFDGVFGPCAGQEEVFDAVLPVVREVLGGVNGCVLCYGQTSAGKTYTMEGGEHERRGLIPRALEVIFGMLSEESCGPDGARSASDVGARVRISMLEIYMERLRDLLDPESEAELSVAEDSRGQVVVRGLSELAVASCQQAIGVFLRGQQNRAVASTAMNDRSSRSHSVCILKLDRPSAAANARVTRKLCLVDLAGSESVKKSCLTRRDGAGAGGDLIEEARAINQSLSTLGLVINRLSERERGERHVPFRSSKLTRVLQDSLGGSSHTALVINCSMSSRQVTETLSTLRFGARARSCVNIIRGDGEGDGASQILRTLRHARQELARLQEWQQRALAHPALQPGGAHAEGFTWEEWPSAVSDGFGELTPMSLISGPSSLQDECSFFGSALSPCSRAPASRRTSRAGMTPWNELSLVRECEDSGEASASPVDAELDLATGGGGFIPLLPTTPTASASASASAAAAPLRSRSRPPRPSLLSLPGGPSRRASRSRGRSLSPLSLSPRSAAQALSLSRRVSRAAGCSPLEITPAVSAAASRRVSRAVANSSGPMRELPSRLDESATSSAAGCAGILPQGFWPWEDPLTQAEKQDRMVLCLGKEIEKRSESLRAEEDRSARLEEQVAALQAETEWLTAERMQYMEDLMALNSSAATATSAQGADEAGEGSQVDEAAVAAASSTADALAAADARAAALEAQLAELTASRSADAATAASRVEQLEAQLHELTASRNAEALTAASRAEQLEAQLAELTASRSSEALTAASRAEQLEAQLAELAASRSADAATASSRVEQLEAQLAELAASRSADALAASSRAEQLEAARAELTARAAEVATAASRVEHLEAALAELTAARAAEVASAASRAEQLEAQLRELEAKHAADLTAAATRSAELEAHLTEMEASRSAARQLEAQLLELRAAHTADQAAAAACARELEVKLAEKETSGHADVTAATARAASLEAELRELERSRAEDAAAASSRAAELEAQLSELESTRSAARALEAELSDLRAAHAAHATVAAASTRELEAKLTEREASVHADATAATARENALQAKLAELESLRIAEASAAAERAKELEALLSSEAARSADASASVARAQELEAQLKALEAQRAADATASAARAAELEARLSAEAARAADAAAAAARAEGLEAQLQELQAQRTADATAAASCVSELEAKLSDAAAAADDARHFEARCRDVEARLAEAVARVPSREDAPPEQEAALLSAPQAAGALAGAAAVAVPAEAGRDGKTHGRNSRSVLCSCDSA